MAGIKIIDVKEVDDKMIDKMLNKNSEEFNLSEHEFPEGYFPKDKVKEFIRETEEENTDFEEDIIALIEINNYGKDDLIVKMRRLCKAHREEIDKLAGDLK